MIASVPYLLAIPPALLVGLVFLPNPWVNRHSRMFRQMVTVTIGLQSLVTAIIAFAYALGWVPSIHNILLVASAEMPIAATIHYDGVASLMLTLVSFVGWVIGRYSIRYLDGESTQGRYFRWVAFTVGSVSLMVISGNLIMFVAAWMMTSLGLHQLLLHYGYRPAAQRAAWTKFTISRIGDAALIIAIGLLYAEFKTFDFTELFRAAGSLEIPTLPMQIASFLLVAGAITKSAQFPFHTWLPQTMETPTPVSALMHAGIVNAGGYLMIRTSPLVSLTPWALTTLAMIGGFTACFAAIIMLTQTSVKKSLAYSTIAQMGFMMFQCGLGAFSAAMLHILAHSLYKAYAFLSSGSVLTQRAPTAIVPTVFHPVAASKLALAAALIVVLLAISMVAFRIDPLTKPGGLLLGSMLCLGLTNWVGQVMRSGNRNLLIRAMAIAGGLCLVYSASFVLVDRIIATSLTSSSGSQMPSLIIVLVLAGFGGTLAWQLAFFNQRVSATLNKWQIHASNGFYLESTLRRVFGPLVNS